MRKLALVLVVMAALTAAASATAAVFVLLKTTTVHRGGVVRFAGYADRLPLYVLPAAWYPCARTNTCTEPLHRTSPPKRPYAAWRLQGLRLVQEVRRLADRRRARRLRADASRHPVGRH